MSLQENKSLKEYNTFGMQVTARYFFEYVSEEELQGFIQSHAFLMENYIAIGGGSNLLFMGDYNGLVLHSGIKDMVIESENSKHVILRVGSSVIWDDFVAYAVDSNWSGAENLSHIPGEVGASPVQNIGAYGVEAKDIIEQVEAIHARTGEKKVFTQQECKHGYRDSIFKHELAHEYVITYVTFKLNKEHTFNIEYGNVKAELSKYSEVNLQNIRKAIIATRESKLPDPEEIKSAGSFFVNPKVSVELYEEIKQKYPKMPHYPVDELFVKLPAAWLIEQCGWKGKRFGDAGVHKQQALVLVNYGTATGADIFHLALEIKDSVLSTFGVELEMEVVII